MRRNSLIRQEKMLKFSTVWTNSITTNLQKLLLYWSVFYNSLFVSIIIFNALFYLKSPFLLELSDLSLKRKKKNNNSEDLLLIILVLSLYYHFSLTYIECVSNVFFKEFFIKTIYKLLLFQNCIFAILFSQHCITVQKCLNEYYTL